MSLYHVATGGGNLSTHKKKKNTATENGWITNFIAVNLTEPLAVSN